MTKISIDDRKLKGYVHIFDIDIEVGNSSRCRGGIQRNRGPLGTESEKSRTTLEGTAFADIEVLI
jgi:hypothetical protein